MVLFNKRLFGRALEYQIGLEEALHFSSFFKKNTGISPNKFRNT